MCQYSPKRFLQCAHFGAPTDMVVTAYCRASLTGQYCARSFAGVFAAPGVCTPCQDAMAAAAVHPAYLVPDEGAPERDPPTDVSWVEYGDVTKEWRALHARASE